MCGNSEKFQFQLQLDFSQKKFLSKLAILFEQKSHYFIRSGSNYWVYEKKIP